MRIALLIIICCSCCFSAIIPADRLPQGGWDPGLRDTNGQSFKQTGVFKPSVTLTNIVNVRLAPYSAAGDGVTDDTFPILNAITNWRSSNAVIYFPAGHYILTSSIISSVNFTYPSIVLRGDGMQSTKLEFRPGVNNVLISFSGSGLGTAAARSWSSTNSAPGETNLYVTNWHAYFDNMEYGFICVSNSFSNSFLAPIYGAPYTDGASYMKECRGQVFKVHSRDSGTLRITIDRPLYFGYDTNAEIRADIAGSAGTDLRGSIGIEEMTITNASAFYGHTIMLSGMVNSWVKNVRSCNGQKWHLRIAGGFRNTVTGFWADRYYPGGSSGGGDSAYGVGLYGLTTDCLVIDSIMDRCRHSMPVEYGCNGNVFAYNYSINPINADQGAGNQELTDYLMGDILAHGGVCSWNLWEGNFAATVRFDVVFGNNPNNTVYRGFMLRRGLPTTYVATMGFDAQLWNDNANLVGSVFGVQPTNSVTNAFRFDTSGDTPTTNTSAFDSVYVHGLREIFYTNTTWAATNADHTLPDSLWLTAKPSFFANCVWPPIGPDVAGYTNVIPAQARFLGIDYTSGPRRLNIGHLRAGKVRGP